MNRDWMEMVLQVAIVSILVSAVAILIACAAQATETRNRGNTDPLILESRPAPLLRLTPADMDTMALTIYAESRGEPLQGQVAIGFVILNRLIVDPETWGKSASAVARRRYQFSVWNTAEQRKALEGLDRSRPEFLVAKLAAYVAATGAMDDPSGGSTHFTAASMAPPRWTKGMTSRRIGNHLFYKRTK